MRSLNLVALIAIAIFLAVGNLWVAEHRSLIPLALQDKVSDIELRHEKHPGHDDVFLVRFERTCTTHVDAEVAELLQVGDAIQKESNQRSILINSKPHSLQWSSDVRGMFVAMPALVLIIVLSGLLANSMSLQSSNSSIDTKNLSSQE